MEPQAFLLWLPGLDCQLSFLSTARLLFGINNEAWARAHTANLYQCFISEVR